MRVYTKSLFKWQKALVTANDNKTLYEFAKHGERNLQAIHKKLVNQSFEFRPGVATHYNFNGKKRTIYLYDWEERIVDTLLFIMLNQAFHKYFTKDAYAYRHQKYSLDLCQKNIARFLAKTPKPVYVIKRDFANYFPSVNHEILLEKLKLFFPEEDYFYSLIKRRVNFLYWDDGKVVTSTKGIPFGCPTACFLANLYLHSLDVEMAKISDATYYRYADDILMLCASQDKAKEAIGVFNDNINKLKLTTKPSHTRNLIFSETILFDLEEFEHTNHFKHLGVEFRANDVHGLSRDKLHKIRNRFRFVLRRKQKGLARLKTPEARAKFVIKAVNSVITSGLRNVAIIDYYLKHTSDQKQLKALDLWLAEEVLSYVFIKGHKKGYFKKISFHQLREWGLISLRHRARLLRHGKLKSSFFLWKEYQLSKKQFKKKRLPS